jgi:hypothetical protein
MPAPPPPQRTRKRNLTEEQFAVLRERARLWRLDNKERVNEIARKSRRKYIAANWPKVRAQRREQRLRRRLKVLAFFGGKCCRCGFSDWRALQIDHINGDGMEERWCRKELVMRLDPMIAADPDGCRARYQCLCANCNWIKRFENDEHPNKHKRRSGPMRVE